jgi:hypothetical protein
MMQTNPEVWDDTEIVSAFQEAISSHRSRNESFDDSKYLALSKKKRKLENAGTTSKDRNKITKQIDLWNDTLQSEDGWSGTEDTAGEGDRETEMLTGAVPTSEVPGPVSDPLAYFNSMTAATLRAVGPAGGQGNAALEEALSSMMMAWYESGYATGRYRTLLELSQQGRCPEAGSAAAAAAAADVTVTAAPAPSLHGVVDGELEEGELSS